MSNLGDRIRELLKERNLEQKQLAQILGMNTTTFNCHITGYRQPDIQTITKLADYFDVSLDYLTGRTDEREVMPRRFYKENIELIRGIMTFEEMAENIGKRLGNLGIFTPEYLENLVKGTQRPTMKHIDYLATYAQVDRDFFYSPNTYESLQLARTLYAKDLESKKIKHLSNKANGFIHNPDNAETVEVAIDIAQNDVALDRLRSFASSGKANEFLDVIEKAQKKGIDPRSIEGFKVGVKF